MGGGDRIAAQQVGKAPAPTTAPAPAPLPTHIPAQIGDQKQAASQEEDMHYFDEVVKKIAEFARKHPPHVPVGPEASAKASVGEFPRISLPISQLKAKYDVVVVGSGYGASVTASRLSRAGKQVCVLELGKEMVPGEYAKSIEQVISCFD